MAKEKDKKKKDLVVIKPKAELSEYDEQKKSIDVMISQALTANVPAETMERFLAMRKELKAEYAKEQYVIAMANFQAECPVIEKKKGVPEKGHENKLDSDPTKKWRYKYATIDSIIDQTKGVISKFGLAYAFRITNDDKTLTATCKVTHSAGHSEENSFIVPLGSEQYMTEVQKFGARSTFAKRYAFCDAFGIMTGDEDIDGKTGGAADSPKITQTDREKAFELLDQCMTMEAVKEAWSKLSKEQKGDKEVVVHANEIIENITYENSQNGTTVA